MWLLSQPGTTWLLGIVLLGWLLLVIWLRLTLAFALVVVGTAVPSVLAWWAGASMLGFAVAGIGVLTFAFLVLTRCAMLALAGPWQIAAVAHTVLKEASRTRMALVFIVILLGLLPLLPLWLDPAAPLRYQVQTFMSWSMTLTFVMLACMTLVLSCATVSFEIRDRQIWQLMTKPVGKWRYLAGKWVGLLTLNAIILLIACLATFSYIQYLRSSPVAQGAEGDMDRIAVTEEILTARASVRPDYEVPTRRYIESRIEDLAQNDAVIAKQLADHPDWGFFKLELDIVNAYMASQRTIPPARQGQPGVATYTFEGLENARNSVSPLTIQYRFLTGSIDEHARFDVGFVFNDDPETGQMREYVPAMTHFLLIPSRFVPEDGVLTVSILNFNDPEQGGAGAGIILFEENGLQVLYRVGSFEGNFFRAALVLLMKLAFLAAMGVTLATFLNFPVALLTCFTIFIAGTIAPYLALSLQWYTPPQAAQVDWGNVGMVVQWAFESLINGIAKGLVFALRSFGDFRPTDQLVEGKIVTWGEVFMSFVRLTVLWSGVSLTLGWIVLRKRQLAIYSGQG
jgi:hypothetical protein